MKKEYKQLDTPAAVLSVVVLILLAIIGMVANAVDSNAGFEVRKVNRVWIDELSKRGLIIKNESGSFKWVEK